MTYLVSWERDPLGLLKPDAATGASVISTPVRITAGKARSRPAPSARP